MNDTLFVNPYIFFSLKGSKTVKNHSDERKNLNAFYQGRHTGYLEVSLVTKTPLFIPNTSNDRYIKPDVPEHKSYDFYSYHNLREPVDSGDIPSYEPIIPGSELRGCIRFMHEVLNNSCLNSIDGKQIVYSRLTPTQASKVEPGILKCIGGTWFFQKADKIRCKDASYDVPTEKIHVNGKIFDSGSIVYFKKQKTKAINISSTKSSYACEHGYIFRMMPHPNDSGGFTEGIFIFKQKGEMYPISEDEMSNLKNVIRNYQDDKVNVIKMAGYAEVQAKDFYSNYLEDENSVYPVFRSKEPNAGGLFYYSPAHIGKYLNYKTLGDKIKGYEACESMDSCCETCSVFGFVGKNSKESHSSRIRFTDATPVNGSEDYKDWYQNPITLSELLGPHLSNLEFYTYSTNGKDKEKGRFDDSDRQIRGRKYYWHHLVDRKIVGAKKGPSKLNVTIRPLKDGKEFRFKVFYENLTEEELQRLESAIDLNRLFHNGKNHMQKLGYAKPFGYGSVEMKILKNVERKIILKDGNIVYFEDEAAITPYESFDANILKEVEYVTDFNAVTSKNVHYPYAMEPADANGNYPGFDWFRNNKSSKKVEQVLPKLPDIISGKVPMTLKEIENNRKVITKQWEETKDENTD